MRRYLIAMVAAFSMLLSLAGVASAAPSADAGPCVPSMVTTEYTDAATHNIIQVTATTTCNLDGRVDDITYDREVLYYWFSNARGGGYYVAAEDMPGPGYTGPVSGRYGR